MKYNIIFRILLVFLLSVIFYYSAGINHAQAESIVCKDGGVLEGKTLDFTFDPANPTTEDETVTITINATGQIAAGTYGIMAPLNGAASPNEGLYPITFNVPQGTNQTASVEIPESNLFRFRDDNKYRIMLVEETEGRVGLRPNIICESPVLLEIIKPGEAPPTSTKCKISKTEGAELTPTSGIQFKVTGLPNDGGTHRGVVITNTSNTDKKVNGCKSNSELENGVTYTEVGGDPIIQAKYSVVITESCFGTESAQGPKICDPAEEVFSILPGGGNTGCDGPEDCTEEGHICLPLEEGAESRGCGPKEAYNWGKTQLACDDLEFDPTAGNGGEMVHTGSFTCKTAIGGVKTNPNDFMQKVLQLIMGLAGGILLILIIINGYKFMVSQGDPEKIKEAREGIIAAIAGILMIIFSLSLLRLITSDILGIPGFR